jgi:hypothetical protein
LQNNNHFSLFQNNLRANFLKHYSILFLKEIGFDNFGFVYLKEIYLKVYCIYQILKLNKYLEKRYLYAGCKINPHFANFCFLPQK